jgi:hemoglobin
LKKDISNRGDVEKLVNTFYDKVKDDHTIGTIFTQIMSVDWDKHLPIMYSFWSSILIDERSYDGNPMPKHIQMSRLTPMTALQFDTWLSLFNQTVDELFEGDKGDDAKTRAANIARLMLHKIEMA